MRNRLPVYIGPDATAHLIQYCREHDLRHFALIADPNTYRALGQSVETTLRDQGWDVLKVMLEGADIIADAQYIFKVLLALDRTPRVYIAVGSGTITDIARFVSHRTRSEFISLPTAASVDGYTSIGAPMVIDGAKTTVNCHGPLAVFADLPTLCAAPRPLIAAGLGDMVAKFTSTADWELGHVLEDEAYDEQISERMRSAARACADRADAIAAGTEEGVQALMEGLIESGFCMLDFGQTLPASGGEHHVSHYLEMKLLWEGRHSILHGAKVGIAVIISARRYAALRQLSREAAQARLRDLPLPDPEEQIRGIRAAFGPVADQIIALQKPWLEMTETDFETLKRRIVARWDDVQRIANGVPPAEDLEHWIRQAGGPVSGLEAGLSEEEVTLAVAWSHNLKDRMTINRLSLMLGIP